MKGSTKNNMITRNIELIRKSWNYTLNSIWPEDVPTTSREQYHFICEHGHQYRKPMIAFIQNPTCNVCYLQKNSIAAVKPYIVNWWNHEKNGDDRPELHLKTSSKVVWWKCPKCGYEWQAEISSRYASKDMCPCCDLGISFKSGVTDALTRCPEIAQDWDYEKNDVLPQDIFIHSDILVHWKCAICGYKWTSKLKARAKKSPDGTYKLSACKCCIGKAVHNGTNSFSTAYPDLAQEYIPELNTSSLESLLKNSTEPIMWRCSKCNQLFSSAPSTRTRFYPKNNGCPYCSKKKPIQGENDFRTYCEQADLLWPLAEWDYDANNSGPEEFYFDSNKKISLCCSKKPEHQWEATCYACTHGRGKCPQCNPEKKAQKLAVAHPELLKYWDYDRNTKDPTKIGEYSNERAHWACGKGHRFQHEVFRFSQKEFYCPICTLSRLVEGVNDFETLYPSLAGEWSSQNLKSAREIMPNSNMPILWDCPDGHPPYERAPRDRINNPLAGCPVCMKTKVVEGVNDAKTFYPRLKPFWNHRKNNNKTLAMINMESQARHDFICKLGHEFRETIPQMEMYGYTCACCEGRVVLPGVNSLEDLFPDYAREWDYTHRYNQDLIPSEVGVLSKIIRAWICVVCGTHFNTSVPERVSEEKGCPVCTGKVPWPGKTSLLAIHPDIASELISHDPDTVFPTAITIGEWKCSICKEIYRGAINLKVSGELQCPTCDGRRVIPGVNTLSALHPDIALEYCYKDRDPDTVLPHSKIKGRWHCKRCGKHWTCLVPDRVSGVRSCPYCAGKKAISGVTSLLALYPNVAKELLDKDPDKVLPISKDYYDWQCTICNQPWRASSVDRINGDASCPYCAGKYAIPGVTSLLALYPDIAKELFYKDPDHMLPSSNAYDTWHCTVCSQLWRASAVDRINGDASCPYCAGKYAIPGVTSLLALYPNIAKELFYKDPDHMLPSSNAYDTWHCTVCSQLWRASAVDRINGDASCPYCAGRRAIPGINSVKEQYPEILNELDELANVFNQDIGKILPTSTSTIRCKCKDCGHYYPILVRNKVRDIKRNRNSCPHCKGYRRKRHYII